MLADLFQALKSAEEGGETQADRRSGPLGRGVDAVLSRVAGQVLDLDRTAFDELLPARHGNRA
jgi:hypothetical protein